jgi:hypothetical protein
MISRSALSLTFYSCAELLWYENEIIPEFAVTEAYRLMSLSRGSITPICESNSETQQEIKDGEIGIRSGGGGS